VNTDLCYATLAFGQPYRDMARQLASDLDVHAPGRALVIATDAVGDFAACGNVVAFAQARTGFFRCVNDKRFAVAHALEHQAAEVVFIDSDTRITQALPLRVGTDAKIASVYSPMIGPQARMYLLPHYAEAVLAAARSFGLDPEQTRLVMDSMFAVKRDQGREKVFIHVWDLVTRYFDFQGMFIADAFCISIGAAVAGWVATDQGMAGFQAAIAHDEISRKDATPSPLSRVLKRGVTWARWLQYRRQVLHALKSTPRL
jgi:hypothetical protein